MVCKNNILGQKKNYLRIDKTIINAINNKKVITFPNAKINLGLNIISKRDDGYHNIETVFYPVKALYDVLEFVESKDKKTNIEMSGINIPMDTEDNIVMKAYRAFREKGIAPIEIRLRKNIPSGAGLGGGSSDGTFMLKLLNEKYKIFNEKELISKSAELGSDCAFFAKNQPVFASERGENLSLSDVNLNGYKIAIVKSADCVSTAQAYANCTPKQPQKSIKEIIKEPIENWRYELVNDFEESVFVSHPNIKKVKDNIYESGAIYASMSGSGASVYGIYNKEESEDKIKKMLKEQMGDYFVFCGTLD